MLFRKKRKTRSIARPHRTTRVKRPLVIWTIKNILETNGLTEGFEFRVIPDHQKPALFPLLRKHYEKELKRSMMKAGSFAAIGGILMSPPKPISPGLGIFIIGLAQAEAYLTAKKAQAAQKHVAQTEQNEINALARMLKEYSVEHELPNGKITHICFTLDGKKVFLLTRKAAVVLKTIERKKVLGRIQKKG